MKQVIPFRKKNPFTNVPGIVMSALLPIFVIASCTKKTNEIAAITNSEEVTIAKGAKPNTLTEVSLSVTVREAVGDKITSDGGGSYTTGSQSVSAVFDQYGNFIFSCGSGGRGNNTYLIRWLNINFDSPIQVFINPPITGNDKVTSITTIAVAAFTFIPLQSLVVGQSECVGLTGGSGAAWVMNFHRNAEDVSSSRRPMPCSREQVQQNGQLRLSDLVRQTRMYVLCEMAPGHYMDIIICHLPLHLRSSN